MPDEKNSKKKAPPAAYRKRFVESDKSASFSSWVKDWQAENYFLNSIFGKKHEKYRLGRLVFCLFFSFVFAFLVSFELNLSSKVKYGEIANQTIRAPFDFEVVDEASTDLSRKKAAGQVPLVLDFFPNIYEKSLEDVRTVFAKQRDALATAKVKESEFVKTYKSDFEKALGLPTSDRLYRWLYRDKFNPEIENSVISALENWSTTYMIDQSLLHEGLEEKFALVRTIGQDGKASVEEQKIDVETIKPLMNYTKVDSSLLISSGLSKYDQKKLAEFIKPFRVPNLSVNRALYSQRKAKAVEKVLPVVISVKQNQVILTEGSLIQDQDVLLLNEVLKRKNSFRKRTKVFIVTILLAVLLMVGISLLKKKFDFDMPDSKQDFLILLGISTVGLILIKISMFLFEGALYQKFGPGLPSQVIILLAPFAVLSMLAALLIKSKELIWLYVVFASVGLSFLVSDKFSFVVIALIAGMASVRAFSVCKSRRDFYMAGVIAGAVIGLASIIMYIVSVESFTDLRWISIGLIFGASVIGGVLSSIFAVTLVPVFESFFDVMTDLKLLELSSLSHPLLQELMVRAPGTYHHCMVVGSMVEAASNEIGVNGLQAKVMAYFHDVGKMEHAQYFIENQRKSYNPHDAISPYLSKTIIIAHVKDGVEIVSKHRLGKAIVAGVKEHHGTTLISYFHNRALKKAEESHEGKTVKEEDFRYPGPKPQSKESAILMIADSIEAAARSLDEPSPLRIQNLIDKMVDSKFSDGQLNECNITFAELTKIKAVFYRVLVGVYHHRVDYAKDPTLKPKQNKENLQPKGPQTVALNKHDK
jgi:putative nucleotidyltransferase with HDIG domain